MSLSRKRQRELDRLKRQAEDLWEEQQEVLDRATALAREARRQAGNYAREEIQPRVRTAYETGAGSVRGVALSARERFVGDVVPAVTGAAASALAAIEVVRDKQLRQAIANAGRFGNELGQKVGLVKPAPAPIVVAKSSPLPWILVGVGVVAAAAVGYAVWQTLRADDDLWVEDEVGESPAGDLVE